MRLSVLDQSPISEGSTAADALRASVRLAVAAENLGVSRYWVAEHHDSPGFASVAPEILVPVLLAGTRRMRVGSGGVLLPRYSASKVAEVFNVLSALYPGRVDLGIGRAGGPADRFPEQLAEVQRSLVGDTPIWLLGGSASSAGLAATLDTAYCFAHFLNPRPAMAALDTYHQRSPNPRSALAVRVLMADTAAKAEELAAGLLLWRSRKDLGDDRPLPSPESTRKHRWTSAELQRAGDNSRALLSGTPEQLHGVLTELAVAHGVDELVVNTLTHDPADRLRSYELLAEVLPASTLTGVG
jgi:alkanesulfonate monooxygenase SsuD/methylene tetrahydromethanopterin reductase-like flavin-dependent oxidoreductase (luciferase family)